MPNKPSAKKELRKNRTRQNRHQAIAHRLKDLSKKSAKALETKSTEAPALVSATLKALDKAAQKGLLKKNTRNRKKSRLQLKLNQLKK